VSTLLESIDRNICARKLFRRGQKILVAVSGGVDSMVLLRLLHELSKKHKWKLTIAHLNHQLRGRSSDADERLVVRAARALCLPIVIERADVNESAKTGRLSVEMAARYARHSFLTRTAVGLKISSIALAHHADDQVELFFVRMLRGSGGEGLSGMKWRGPSPFALGRAKPDLVRPLLGQRKESLREYAMKEKVESREDASNASPDILRNRIRHELLPLLRRKYQPAVDRVVLRLIEIVNAEIEVTHEAARNWITGGAGVRRAAKPRKGFEQLPVAIQRLVIQLELRRHKIAADFGLVEALRAYPSKPVAVSPRTIVFRDPSGSVRVRQPLITEPDFEEIELVLNGAKGDILFGGNRIQWKVGPQKTFRVPSPRAGHEVFDADTVGSRVVLRHWRPGDRFQPIGMAKPVKLQDLFTNLRVPRADRHKLVVATTVRNELFWVEKLRISERFKLSEGTKRRLMWQWKSG
jgi:tRNA(Ile)-lysidine synthase